MFRPLLSLLIEVVDTMTYVPNELLGRLVGDRMYSVEFVLNDYVQLRFDGLPGSVGPIVLNCYVWPVIEVGGHAWRESEVGYADALRRLTPGTVLSTVEGTGVGIRIVLDTGAIVIHPSREEVYLEIAEIAGFPDGEALMWFPGDIGFEDAV